MDEQIQIVKFLAYMENEIEALEKTYQNLSAQTRHDATTADR